MNHESQGGRSKKRLAIVAAVGGAMLATFGVYATVLTVSANQDAGGTDTTTTCDADGVVASTGTPTFNSATQKYEVTTITVQSIDDVHCAGQVLYVTAIKNDDTALKAITPYTIVAETTEKDFTVASFALEDLKGYAVAIHQPTAP